jgi:signal transduction histidine kinase
MADRPRILIVDDEMGVRESLRALLQSECEVSTASTGEEALQLLSRQPVDVMTLDLKMPGLGGISVLERAKQIDPDLEVLIITGYGSLDTAVQGLRYRALDYLSKPFDCDHVRRLVNTALARRTASRRLKAAPEQLLSTLSHEFRTPLNVIMGYSSMLQDDGPDKLSDEQRQALDRIQSNSATLLAYVEGLLYLAELDRGLVNLAVTPVQMDEAMGQIANELSPRAAEKGLGWRVDVAPNLALVTDEDKLLRLVRLFADNAVRYTSAGEVVVMARSAPDGITVEVRDTGPGLPADVIRETEALASGRPGAEGSRGLGFGLRLAGRLLRTLNATITVATGTTGTTVHLRLPHLAVEIPAPQRASA